MEHVLQRPDYRDDCRSLSRKFGSVLSRHGDWWLTSAEGSISLSYRLASRLFQETTGSVRVIRHKYGMKAKPEVGILLGAGGGVWFVYIFTVLSSNSLNSRDTDALEETGISNPDRLLTLTRRFLDEAGVKRILMESEGITEKCQDVDNRHYKQDCNGFADGRDHV